VEEVSDESKESDDEEEEPVVISRVRFAKDAEVK
jgi:hypothetical protein